MKNRITKKVTLLFMFIVTLVTGYSQWTAVNMQGIDSAYNETNFMIAAGSRLFVGTNTSGVYMSDDNGQTWVPANTGIDGNENVKGFLLKDTNLYVSLNRDGVYRTNPASVNWVKLTGGANLPTNQDYSNLAIIEDSIYIGTNGSSIYRWIIGGSAWVQITGLPSANVNFVANDHQQLVAGLNNAAGFAVFNHATKTWTTRNTGLDGNGITYLFVTGNRIYAATKNMTSGELNKGVYSYQRDSLKWTRQIKNSPNYGNVPVNFIDTLGGQLLLGTNVAGLWQSPIQDTLNWSPALDIQPKIRYVLPSGLGMYLSTNKGIFFYSMGGFVRLSNGLPRSLPFIKKVIENAGKYYALTTSGLYESNTGDGGWSLFGTNSRYKDVTALYFGPTATFSVINGILHTYNGSSWDKVPALSNITVLDRVNGYKNGDTNYIFCGTGWTGVPCGIQKSVDGGNTWKQYNKMLYNTWDSCWKSPASCREGLYVGTDYRYTLGEFVYDTGSKTLFTNGKFPIIFSKDNGITWTSRKAKNVTQNIRYVFTRTYQGKHYMFHGAQNDGSSDRASCRGLINDTVVTNSVPLFSAQEEGNSMADFGENLLFLYGLNLLRKSEDNGTTWVPFITDFNFTGYNKSALLTRAGNYLYVGKNDGTAMRYDLVTPPAFNIPIAVSNITQTTATLSVNPTRPGTAYFVVLPDSATPPNANQVMAGLDAFNNPVAQSGNSSVLHNVLTNINIIGLSAGQDYTVYVVVRSEVIVNSGVVSTDFSTMGYNVTFLVSDGTTPINGAIVEFNLEKDTTDASGLALFTDVAPGAGLAYTAKATNYADTTGTIDVSANITDTIYMRLVVNVPEINADEITAYPIPVSSSLTVEVPNVSGNVILQIADVNGQILLLLNEQATGTLIKTLDLSALNTGTYILTVKNKELSTVKKIIKN